MRFVRKHRTLPTGLNFNATPLIDVIFTMSIFYMLVSRFSSAELVPMQLPKPEESQARVAKMPDRVVINCRLGGAVPEEADRVLYSIGPNNPEPLSVIAERLADLKRQSPEVKVVVRADRRIPYADVRAVMRLIAQHGIDMLNVAALADEKR